MVEEVGSSLLVGLRQPQQVLVQQSVVTALVPLLLQMNQRTPSALFQQDSGITEEDPRND